MEQSSFENMCGLILSALTDMGVGSKMSTIEINARIFSEDSSSKDVLLEYQKHAGYEFALERKFLGSFSYIPCHELRVSTTQ
jgi:hypothetical protein